ncbi:mycofactocin-coupled SDR family oxidoreductase [Rhodococcus sp. NBC_00294]|uniref:mycofactocin-coupled SDR family oxidoreductase n=1 Tax=Rhodococcus sp. NBC_00294 TaxID=2976004 RepID=UPI002E2C566A|nr:mycofactocin-coupled SDR family oxidoreductase [Rhodococcus sp. NBC_00294]
MGEFDGKVAFITGAARGQGRAHAVMLAEGGADIIGLDLCDQVSTVDYPMSTVEDLDETVKLVEKTGRRMIAEVGDVRKRDSVESIFRQGLAEFGRIDFVIANAGIMPIWGEHSDTPQAWTDCLDIMLTGVLNTVEVTWPTLVEQGDGGSIVIVSSMASVQPIMRTLGGRTLGGLAYGAAKAGVVNLMENYASVLAPHYVRVNSVHPSGVRTPMITNDMVRARFDEANPEDLKALVNAIPVDLLEVDDVSNAVQWLCSDKSRFYTGSQMRIDAGAALR